MFSRLWRTFFQLPLVLRLFLLVFLFMFLFGYLIHVLEPDQFQNVFDGIWWAFITGSTVGYGDFVPNSYWGRVMALILILIGGGVFTFLIATIASGTVKMKSDYSEGKMTFNGQDHYIIVGWNERSSRLIEIIQEELRGKEKIVLIDESLEEDPIFSPNAQFIKGDPTIDKTWDRANIKKAKKVIITSNQSLLEKDADRLSILLTLTARGRDENVPIVVEILTKEQVVNAQRAGATDVISTNETISTLFFHELIGEQHTQTFEYVNALLSQQRFNIIKTKEEWVGQTILNISYHLKKEGFLLLGIIRKYEIDINPEPKLTLKEDDVLIITKGLL